MAGAAFHPPVPAGGIDRAAGADFPRLARRLFGNVRLDFTGAGNRESRLVSVALGPCRLSRLSADRHMVHGDRVTEGDAPDMVKLIIQTKGHSWLHQSGRRLPVGPSSVVLYDPANPYLLANPEAVDLLMLQVPRGCLPVEGLGVSGRPLAASLIPGSMHRVLFSMMESTICEIETLDEAERTRLGNSMMELVRGMLEAASEAPPVPRSLDLLRARIKDYVAANLSRPELGAPEIARRMGCSLRYVYRAFETEGMTPADYIWSERLRKAAELLSRQPMAPGMIGEVAFSLGFSSSAHFSRAFRNRFHQSPTEWSRSART
ncbi:helix-turn-helix domain-containing protein [Gellertiella hungarica]|uniref:AraC family transcriptional activator of tynA and feaB n=1 Tax=Gellertiella hungarica TaxID=1572859 RepID=A0A7W6J314_9HYPH|nr:helix-turn-helix domain-containing protein [Gellertiella hungarica]MBB4063081.1 AraC family transcriptional activator of tynA and feaB [Gellertiella hungarica]